MIGAPAQWTDWHDDLQPERVPIYTINTLEIDAPAERVWPHLIRATDWPSFYRNAKDVRIESDEAELGAGTWFNWRTFGLRVRTQVVTFEPPLKLAWRGDTWYGRGMHTWLFAETPSGCVLVTEEAQAGFVPWIARWYLRRGLRKWHQRWLEGLRDESSAIEHTV